MMFGLSTILDLIKIFEPSDSLVKSILVMFFFLICTKIVLSIPTKVL